MQVEVNIDALPSGDEMDTLVASKVMGWEPGESRRERWSPSRDVRAAWEVVTHFEQLGATWQLAVGEPAAETGDSDSRVTVEVRLRDGRRFGGRAPGLPLAVCRAALKTVDGTTSSG